MTTRVQRPPSDGPGQDPQVLIARQRGPALIVEPETARIVAANAAGLSQLGLGPSTRLPLSLDSAMPAIGRLRQIAKANPADARREIFNFWIDGRIVRLAAIAGSIAESRHSLVLISPEETGTRPSPEPAAVNGHAKSAAAAGEIIPPPPAPRDDAQTLKDIARAIREGRLKSKPLDELDDRETTQPAKEPANKPEGETLPVGPIALPLREAEAPHDAAYLARLAHELKTPLSAIVAAAEIMRDERLGDMGNPKYLGYAGDIHESASHALAVINRTLGGATEKCADELATIRCEAVDLNALVRTAVSPMQPLATARNLTLALELEDGLPTILADPTAIRQIVFNLVTNALKFTARNGDVRVATGYLEDGGVFLVVRDTGEGMDADTLQAIFEHDAAPYGAMRPGGGYGIGLPLVRTLAADNAAELEIDSAPGKGTVVLIGFSKDRIVGV